MSSAARAADVAAEWTLPARGRVGIAALIITETAMFSIFVVAYLYYVGKSISGPKPRDVLDLPIVASLLLWSSSVTIHVAVRGAACGAAADVHAVVGRDRRPRRALPGQHRARVDATHL